MPGPFTPAEVARYYKVRGPGIRQTGHEWRGPCPLHVGKRDSFAVNPLTGDWFCHSECGRGGSLIDFEIELSGKTFSEGAVEARAIVGRLGDLRKGAIVSTYDYVDEDGKLLFQCVRHEPKHFSQRRPDGSDRWIWNLQGVRRVLFRLPTLKDAETVLIAEGEKDVLNLVKRGFVATCNPMGAGKWRTEYSDQLAGKQVVIFPDNDEVGERHCVDVARSLQGKATSVRIVRIPVGKDASDWIAAGATRDDLLKAIGVAAVYSDRAASDTPAKSTDWASQLLMSDRGAPRAVLANAITALRLAPEWDGVLAFDEFSLGTMALKDLPWQASLVGAEWTDHEDRLTADWLQHHGIYVTVEIAGLAVQTVAKDRTFHPVRERLDALKWDGVDRIHSWLSAYLGVKPTEYTAAVGARWLISAVARIYRPGAKADCALILEGEQGLMKSTALKTLAEPWFTDEIADLGSKDAAMQTRGVWVIEIAELDSMSRADVSKVKGFISRTNDRFRPPYAKRLIESPRQCVFAGSVNHCTYLRDETGGRRFWPVACTRIRLEELERDRDQLWAEAVARFRDREPWWLDTVELNLAAEQEQADRYEGDAWDELIADWTKGRQSVSLDEVLTLCLVKPKATWAQFDRTRIARCLRALGWERFKAGPRSVREWRYRRRAASHSLPVSQPVSQEWVESGSPETLEKQPSTTSVHVAQCFRAGARENEVSVQCPGNS
ncbi:MAG TPA: VapE domain-containing protein [Bryobacteraceae bacterium]